MRSLFRFMFSYFTVELPYKNAVFEPATYTNESLAVYSTGWSMPFFLLRFNESRWIESSMARLCRQMARCNESIERVSIDEGAEDEEGIESTSETTSKVSTGLSISRFIVSSRIGFSCSVTNESVFIPTLSSAASRLSESSRAGNDVSVKLPSEKRSAPKRQLANTNVMANNTTNMTDFVLI